MKKFELTNETCSVLEYKTLYRIRALKDFSDVKAGDLGGFVMNEKNLSQEGNCWVYDDARVFDDARVYGDAGIGGQARVCDMAQIFERACVSGYTKLYDKVQVFGCAHLNGDIDVYDNAKIHDHVTISSYVRIGGNADIHGVASLNGPIHIAGDAYISSSDDYVVVKGFGSVNRDTVFYLTKNNDIYVVCGCFQGTLQQFREQVRNTHGTNEYAKEYLMFADLVEIRFGSRKQKKGETFYEKI